MRHLYLVGYDVSDPKRLRRVFKTLRRFGEHLQYSIFSCDLSAQERITMLGALTKELNLHEDRAMIVDLGPAHDRTLERFVFLGDRPEPFSSAREPVVI